MGTVRPPPSDARMAAALMPIWSVTKLQTVLMDQTRCIVNNVSSSNSGLEHLVYAQEWAQYKLHLLTQCFLLPCILTADAAWTLFAVLPYLQVLLIFLVAADCYSCFSCWDVPCTLFAVPACKTWEPVLSSSSSILSLNDLTCSPHLWRWENKPLVLPVCPASQSPQHPHIMLI